MALIVNSNPASISAQRNLANSTNSLGRSVERLSSGLRITRAADDAAGLGLSESLRAQIRSINQATRNASDGISLTQIADGAASTIGSLLARLRELSSQSASGTVGNTERSYIDQEFIALRSEIDRIAQVTEFKQAAQDAIIVVGDPTLTPLTFQRSSNTITDAIAGVTLTLSRTTGTGTVAVNVSRDAGAVKTNIKALATAYNEVVKFINERNTYDIATKEGGIFFNEPTVRTVLSQLRTALSSAVPGLTTYTTVGQVGFKTERDGTATIDEAKLDAALSANYSAVKSLFINQTGSTGIAQLVTNAVDALDDIAAGAVTLRKGSLTDQIADLTDDIARKEDLLSQYEERLRRQYAALDGLLGRLQSQSGFLQANSTLK
ncbi:MAG: flagellar filament capping protein FliD [Nitrospira sp.]|nr:flagellar filament capping protein FliD [Nitrospira sp.]